MTPSWDDAPASLHLVVGPDGALVGDAAFVVQGQPEARVRELLGALLDAAVAAADALARS